MFRHGFQTLVAAIFALQLLSVSAFADKRVALVIGNSAYEHTQPLKNPANDAQAMAQALKTVGFDTVTVSLNQKMTELRRTLQRFGRLARRADIALVFYAGHGMEFGGKNYLVPTDARIETDQDIDFETVPLDLLMRAVEPARNLRIVILDACRNNPLAGQMQISSGATRSIGRGLARVEPNGDTLVAYSARAGSVAEDGDGVNSPYTTSLIKHLATPGLDIRVMFGRVRDSVRKRTNQRQEPFTYGSIGGSEFYLVPPEPEPVVAASPAKAVPEVDPAALTYWNLIKDKDNPALFKSFLKRYPSNFLSDLAQVRLDETTRARDRLETERKAAEKLAAEKREAEKRAAAKRAADARTIKAAEKLAAEKKAAEQREAERKAEEKRAAAEKLAAERREAERKAAENKAAKQRKAERSAAELSYWDTIKSDRNPASFEAYLIRYPDGLFADLARIRLSALKRKPVELASLSQASDTPPSALEGKDLTLALQTELNRVGCDPGTLDGQWGAKGRAALMRFNHHAKLNVPAAQPTNEAVDAIRKKTTAVCPKVVRRTTPSTTTTSTKTAPIRRTCHLGDIEGCRRGCRAGYPRACAALKRMGG